MDSDLKKSSRIEQPGEQLTAALEAFKEQKSIPGFCNWTPLVGNDWGPGGFIESAGYDTGDIREQVEKVLRSEAAFHSLYADKLSEFRSSIQEGKVSGRAYPEFAGKKPLKVAEKPGRLGYYFDIYYGQRSLHNKEQLVHGESLIISASGTNNGCYGFYKFDELIEPPFVTIPGTGSIGEAYVQTWPCGVTDHCLVLIPRMGTQEELLWVAAAVVRLEQWRFNYGRGITAPRIADFVMPAGDKGLLAWVRERRAETTRLNEEVLRSFNRQNEEALFKSLVDDWRKSRKRGVDLSGMIMHPAYQRIIGMGKSAVPFILRELEQKPDHWFWALHAITGANPVPQGGRGKS